MSFFRKSCQTSSGGLGTNVTKEETTAKYKDENDNATIRSSSAEEQSTISNRDGKGDDAGNGGTIDKNISVRSGSSSSPIVDSADSSEPTEDYDGHTDTTISMTIEGYQETRDSETTEVYSVSTLPTNIKSTEVYDDDEYNYNSWNLETAAVVYSLGSSTLLVCIIGLGLNIINLQAFGIMKKSVTYTYFQLVIKCDTVRLVSCGAIALLMMIFTTDSFFMAYNDKVKIPSVVMFISHSLLLFCIDVSCVLELCINIDRLIAMTSNRQRSKSEILQNPNAITLVSVVVSALLLFARAICRYFYQPLFNPLTQIIVFLPLVVKVITVVVIVVLLVYVVRHNKIQRRILPAQDGPRYLRHKLMLSTTRSVMLISLLSITLSLAAAAIPLYYSLKGQENRFISDAVFWCKFIIIYTFFECLGCVSFFFHMALIKDFREAFKKISFKRWNVCKVCQTCNNQVAPTASEQITDAHL